MKRFLRIFLPSVEQTVPVVVSPDAETLERFNVVSQFILESQKQYFDSLRFSLNMWVVINSGAAIAFIGKGSSEHIYEIALLMAGALAAGVGNIVMYRMAYDIISETFSLVSKGTELKVFFSSYETKIKEYHNKYIAIMCATYSGFGFTIIRTALLLIK